MHVCACVCVCMFLCVLLFQCNFNVGMKAIPVDHFLQLFHKIYMQYPLHLTCCMIHPKISSLFTNPRNIVICASHVTSHLSNSTRPPLTRPSQCQTYEYITELFCIHLNDNLLYNFQREFFCHRIYVRYTIITL